MIKFATGGLQKLKAFNGLFLIPIAVFPSHSARGAFGNSTHAVTIKIIKLKHKTPNKAANTI